MTDDGICYHDRVERGVTDGVFCWNCIDCGEAFVPDSFHAEAVSNAIEHVVETTSEILWRFHQRAVQAHGKHVADELVPDSEAPEEHTEHVWDFESGVCGYEGCNATLWIGDNP